MPTRSSSGSVPFFVLLFFTACFCSCEHPSQLHWQGISRPLSEWNGSRAGKALDTTGVQFPYAHASLWETSLSWLPDSGLKQVCFMAPDLLQFDLLLNNKVLIHADNYTHWPASLNPDSIYIFPSSYSVRRYAIDPLLFQTLYKKENNVLSLRIKGKVAEDFNAEACILYAASDSPLPATVHTPAAGATFVPGKLPVISILAENYSIPNEPKGDALMKLKCNKHPDCDEVIRHIKIEVRGFSSSSYDKKQYSFNIAGDSTQKEKLPLLGMNPSRKWILHGPYSDPSLIRNALVYELWRQMGYWGAHSRYVELVLNGNYQGVYLLMERVETSKSRLDLKTDSSDCTSFLVQLNRNKPGDEIIRVREHAFVLSDPPGTQIDDDYRRYVQSQLEVFTENLKDPMPHSEALDLNSFADYMLVQEMVKNVDAYKVSTYFHKDASGLDDRLRAGPVWDFDLSMGSSNILRAHEPSGWIYATDNAIPFFFRNKFEDPGFYSLLQQRYATWRKSVWKSEHLHEVIDSLVMLVGEDAASRNFERFPILGLEVLGSYQHVPPTHEAEIAQLKSWLTERLKWMDQYFGVQTSAAR